MNNKDYKKQTGSENLKPLSVIPSGDKVRLVSIQAGRGLKSRLAAMGLIPNSQITVIDNGHPGPFVVKVTECKMMLGRGMAQKILVRYNENPDV